MKFLLPILFIVVLSACSTVGNPNTQHGSDKVVSGSQESAQIITQESNPSLSPEKNESYQKQAVEWIEKSFSINVSNIDPTTDLHEGLTVLRYNLEDTDFFVVELRDNLLYPSMIYHFCHLGADPGFDLATESSDYFKDEFISTASSFINSVFGVDCSDAIVHAYGYGNKIAVQFEVSPDVIFQVRFYYNESKPVGVLYFDSVEAFELAMEANNAQKYF